MVTAKPMEVSGILMVVARIVQNGRILISGEGIQEMEQVKGEYEVWKESYESRKAECARVFKLDCIGHVQKMWTYLHELRKKQPKLKDRKSVKGSKHRLADKNLDKLQTYYGNAIRANVKPGRLTPQEQKEQIEVMQKAILTVLYHTCEIENNKKRHKYCPPEPDG